MKYIANTLRGLNFAGIKFRGFRGFRKKCEIKSRRKICNWPSAKLYSLYSIQNVGLG